ncbi:minor capsid protein [Paenibacillus pinistramenti]|uniref:minor capsid protein n=1 Tax=Paenibacillus pinistramenti TaxID=1768003 RepID=UPI001108B344|nr:minor capsid protein [Paenibacillus pinistramenti]
MKSAEYWAKRMEELQESLLSKGDAYAADMRKEYDKALARITADVERWYGRLAANNEVSLADAKKLLSKSELKEFKWTVEEYIERGRENAIDQRWAKELENASAKTHINRLEQIQTQIRNEVEQLSGRQQKGATKVLGETYKDGYYHSIYELEKGKGFGTGFAKLDAGQIDKTLAKPWAPDGSNFSSRIWADRTKLVNELQTTLTQSLINGSTSNKLISDFAKRMGVAKSNAERLILTEAAHFAGQSRLDAYKETGVKEFEFLATLDKRTSEICRSMDGNRIKLGDAQTGVNYPPLHVRCRSTTVPVVEDAEPTGERAAQDDDGNYYTVPEDTTYADWAAKRAPEAVKPVEPEVPEVVDPPLPSPLEPPEAADSEPPPFAPAESIKKAEEAALNDYGFDRVDYTGMDLDSANSINEAISKALTEFPAIKGFAKTIQAVDTDEFVAQASLGYAEGILQAELKVSSHYYNSTDIDDIIRASVDAQHWPAGSNKQSIFIHEFGHLLEYAHALKLFEGWTGIPMSEDDIQIAFMRINRGIFSAGILQEALRNLGLDHTPEVIKRELSNYANTNTKEVLAEAVAEAVGSDSPRRLASEILKILKQKLKEVEL